MGRYSLYLLASIAFLGCGGDDTASGGASGAAGAAGSGGTGGAAPACAEPGDSCSAASCCDDSTCITPDNGDTLLCAANCAAANECMSECCTPLVDVADVSVCAPRNFCAGGTGGSGGTGGTGATGGTGGSGGADPTCTGAGSDCSLTDCCTGLTCVDPGVAAPACWPDCTSGSDCTGGCCLPLNNNPTVSVCSPPSYCSGIGPCAVLVLLGDDGEYLGDAVSDPYATDGVCNEYSMYGSPYATNSIFNQYGTYGSDYGQLSAYNNLTSSPPGLFCESTQEWFNPVTKNDLLASGIDPDALCATLASWGR